MANEQMIKFWWQSGLEIRIRIRIATLVRRALLEVCTVIVLLAINVIHRWFVMMCLCPWMCRLRSRVVRRQRHVVDVINSLVVGRRTGCRRASVQILRHSDPQSGVDGVLDDGRLIDVQPVREAVSVLQSAVL